MKALRVHVERIVRPIHASVRRKNKMREELLAHLTAAFEEERNLADSDDVAIERATERLGEPVSLRAELQASVPWVEHMSFAYLRLRLDPESYGRNEPFGWRGAARIATAIVGLVVALRLLVIPIYSAADPDSVFSVVLERFATVNLFIFGVLLVCLWIAFFVTHLLSDITGARRAMSVWSDTSSLVKAGLSISSIAFAAGLFMVMAVVSTEAVFWRRAPQVARSIMADAQSVPYWLWLAVPCAALLYTAVVKHRERRQYDKWGSLDVDTDPGQS
jgi:hypothetical protein